MQSEILNRRFFSHLRRNSANYSVHRKFFSQNKGSYETFAFNYRSACCRNYKLLQSLTLIRHIQRQIRPTFQRQFLNRYIRVRILIPQPGSPVSRNCRVGFAKSPPRACGLFAPIKSLCFPSLANWAEFSSPVSTLNLRYTQILSDQLRD